MYFVHHCLKYTHTHTHTHTHSDTSLHTTVPLHKKWPFHLAVVKSSQTCDIKSVGGVWIKIERCHVILWLNRFTLYWHYSSVMTSMSSLSLSLPLSLSLARIHRCDYLAWYGCSLSLKSDKRGRYVFIRFFPKINCSIKWATVVYLTSWH